MGKAKLQIELTMNEYEFCRYDASSIALACLLNAIDGVVADEGDDDDMMLLSNIERTIGAAIDADGETIRDLRSAMYELMDSNNETNTCAMRTSKPRMAGVGSSCGGEAAIATKRNSIHQSSPCSPRTVVTAVASSSSSDASSNS